MSVKKLLAIMFLCLFSENAYSENITIKCVDKKRDIQQILNFDEGGNWILFNGRRKEVDGRKDTPFGEQLTIVEITKDKIEYTNIIDSAKTHTVMIINRFDGSMYQYGKIDGGERYDFHYKCEKSDRKF
jgi:hypothetical protein